MAEVAHIGITCDCPHCYAQFKVPEASTVNKEKFVEPKGLRRVLKQVRDQEWEMLRRNLRAAKAHGVELEAELHHVQTALAERVAASKPDEEKAAEIEGLRKQLTEVGEQFAQANQAFISGRKQQDTVIEHLRRELEAARLETGAIKKKNEELARLMQSAREEIVKARDEKSGDLIQEVERLREELTETRNKLEAEQAKVVVMEAAGISADLPLHGEVGNGGGDPRVQELQDQVAELRKSNNSLRAARDKVHAELVQLKEQSATGEDGNHELQMALGHLEEGMNEVLELITARRSPAKGAAWKVPQ